MSKLVIVESAAKAKTIGKYLGVEEVVRLHASSGTTGKQIVVGYTRNDLDVWSDCCARALTAAGADEKDFMHVSYGYGLFTGGLGLHGGAEKVGMTVIPVST